ncbi:hypothetical protein P280DRAFT_522396 [Massarina eburnea CBS 473.64]|uniref:Uncharacterized protein n=1 Tax=Massarina eburnea CBS 473.64 TaxID=1395130 RepID=A0A6A6RPN6_9PLEO|nr:hypothetical protein P280DRAFT_522396 [Massarina eburnea CBS 473.64]
MTIPQEPTKLATIANVRLSHATANILLKHLHTIHESLAIALEFLRGFQEAGWPTPVLPTPKKRGSSKSLPQPNSLPSQIDQDIIVARHLALTAMMRKLVDLDEYPREGEKWVEFMKLNAETQGISEWFVKNHGLSDEDREKEAEMKEMEMVWEWYVDAFAPALVELIELLRHALNDEARWKASTSLECTGIVGEKPLPPLPSDADPTSSSSPISLVPTAGPHAGCTSSFGPMLRTLLSRRAHDPLQRAGFKHKTAAEEAGYDQLSFRARVERATGVALDQ